MAKEDKLKEDLRKSVKNIVGEVVYDITYRISKAITIRLIKRLREETLKALEKRLRKIAQQELQNQINETIEEIMQEGFKAGEENADFSEALKQDFSEGFQKHPWHFPLKTVIIPCVTVAVIGGGAWAAWPSAPTPELKPDLTITQVRHTFTDIGTIISYRVTNQGDGDAGESITQLIYKGQVLGTDTIGPVPVGGTIDHGFMPCPLPTRGFEVTIFADSSNYLDESNEDNNYTSYEWVPPPISSPSPPPPSPSVPVTPTPPPTVEPTPSTPLYTWLADPASAVFEDQRVREAVGLAINEEYITNKILLDIGGVFSPEEVLYWQYSGKEWSLQDYDVPLARQLLLESGYPDGFSVNIAVVPPGDQYIDTIVKFVIRDLQEVGIIVNSVAYFDIPDAIPESVYQIIIRIY
jgi:hypothetical protein